MVTFLLRTWVVETIMSCSALNLFLWFTCSVWKLSILEAEIYVACDVCWFVLVLSLSVAKFSKILMLALLGGRQRGSSRLRWKRLGGCGTRTWFGCWDTAPRVTKGTLKSMDSMTE